MCVAVVVSVNPPDWTLRPWELNLDPWLPSDTLALDAHPVQRQQSAPPPPPSGAHPQESPHPPPLDAQSPGGKGERIQDEGGGGGRREREGDGLRRSV